MKTLNLAVKGMTCQGCVRSVTRVLSAVPGVESAEVSLENQSAKVNYDPARADALELKKAVERAGYRTE